MLLAWGSSTRYFISLTRTKGSLIMLHYFMHHILSLDCSLYSLLQTICEQK